MLFRYLGAQFFHSFHSEGQPMKRIPLHFLICSTLFLAPQVRTQGKFSGYMFGDYYYNIQRDSSFGSLGNTAAESGPKSYQAFQFRRIYFTYDNTISEKFSSRFRLEADQVARTSDSKISVFVKEAYLKWKGIFNGSDFFFGIHPTPAFGVSEDAWGYRSLEKTIMDLRGIVPSRDLGVALKGKFDEDARFNYWVMVGNNSGNRPETDKYKRFYLLFHVKPVEGMQFTVYGDYADRGNITDPYSTSTPKQSVSNGSFTTGAFVGYEQAGVFSVGIEGFLQVRQNGFNNTAAGSLDDLKGSGVSLFGSVSVQSDLDIVGRYDFYDPNTDSNVKGDARHFILWGVAWKPDKNVSIMPNLQVETYQSVQNGRSIDPSVTGRLTFFYTFL